MVFKKKEKEEAKVIILDGDKRIEVLEKDTNKDELILVSMDKGGIPVYKLKEVQKPKELKTPNNDALSEALDPDPLPKEFTEENKESEKETTEKTEIPLDPQQVIKVYLGLLVEQVAIQNELLEKLIREGITVKRQVG